MSKMYQDRLTEADRNKKVGLTAKAVSPGDSTIQRRDIRLGKDCFQQRGDYLPPSLAMSSREDWP